MVADSGVAGLVGYTLAKAKSPFWKSWCGQSFTVWMDGAVQHEADHGKGDYGLGHLWL